MAPDQIGVWVTLTTFSVYASFLRLGIPNGMNRELPYYMGKNDKAKAMAYAETTLAYSLATSGLLLLLTAFFYLFADISQLEEGFIKALPVFVIMVVTEPYSTYLSSTFRTSDNFKRLSDITIIITIIRAGSIYLVYLWGFDGYLIRELINTLVFLFLLHFWRPLPSIKPSFDLALFKELFNVGFRIFIGSFVFTFINSIPRLFLIKYSTTQELGLFSPVVLLITTVSLVPSTLNSYLYPRFSQKLGENSSRASFWKNIRNLYLLSVIIAIPTSLFVFFSIDHIIELFPKYKAAIPYIKLSCLAILFVGFNLGTVLLVVFKEWKWYACVVFSFGVIQILSIIILRSFFADNLITVTLSLGFTYFFMFVLTLFVVKRVTLKKT